MARFINKLINYILKTRKQKLERTLSALNPRPYADSTSKVHVDGTATLEISSRTKEKIEKTNKKIKNIVKPLINEPEKILDFVKEHGTEVYRFPQAKAVLDYINEEEGFITPKKGFNALWLNFAISALLKGKLKISFSTKAMFIMRESDINIYCLLLHFHKWYSYKSKLPGFDEKAQKLFKENFDSTQKDSSKHLTIEEMIALKEAIARDREASDFVLNIAKEISIAKNVHTKMQQDGGAQI